MCSPGKSHLLWVLAMCICVCARNIYQIGFTCTCFLNPGFSSRDVKACNTTSYVRVLLISCLELELAMLSFSEDRLRFPYREHGGGEGAAAADSDFVPSAAV